MRITFTVVLLSYRAMHKNAFSRTTSKINTYNFLDVFFSYLKYIGTHSMAFQCYNCIEFYDRAKIKEHKERNDERMTVTDELPNVLL